MSSRRYVKRVWRVPKDRGALEYFATLMTKALIKHGWPAKWVKDEVYRAFFIKDVNGNEEIASDFIEAISIAAHITARTYRVEIEQNGPWVMLAKDYSVTVGGHFREIKG